MMKKQILAIVAIPAILANFAYAQTWSTVSNGVNNAVLSLGLFNSELYAGGVFDLASGIPASRIAKWNGTNWSALGPGIKGMYVFAISEFNGELFAGGRFDTAGNIPVRGIARWNGTAWSAAGSGIASDSPWPAAIHSLAVYNGELYAGGTFDSIDGISAYNIAKWNGSSWSPVGTGINRMFPGTITIVNTLLVYNGELYAGGLFDIAGGTFANSIAKWNSSTWSTVGNGFPCAGVFALDAYNGDLFAGGSFDTVMCSNSSNHIARWDSSNWSFPGSGIDNDVIAMISYQNELVAAGHVNVAGGTSVQGIARWNGTTWSGLGTGIIGLPYALAVFNNDLYVGGSILTSGGISTPNISRWNSPPAGVHNLTRHSFDVYPNPFTRSIRIENNWDHYTLEVSEVTGKILLKEVVYTNTVDLDLSRLSPGIYVLTILNKGSSSRKIIMKN